MRLLELGKYWAPQRGGMETLLRQTCVGLAGRGHRVRALVAAAGPDDERATVGGVELWRLARFGELASVPVCPGIGAAIRRSLLDLDPDLVHLHLPHPLAAAAWLAFGDARPLAVTYHSDIVRQRGLVRLWAPWRERILARARVIHTTSEALIESSAVLARHRERCRAVPPGIDPAPWQDVDPGSVERWRRRIGEDAFLFVGRLVYYKGVEVLIDALRGTDLRIAICGSGPLRGRLEARARDCPQQVVFLGDVEDGEMPALFAAARGLVLPSVAPSETFGLVQLEAMAAGLPLVVSRASAGVVAVHADADSALLVPPRDPVALREALLRVRDESGVARGLVEAAARLLRSRYRAEDRLDDFESLLKDAAGLSTAP